MRKPFFAPLVLALALVPATGSAQRTIAHDTMSMDSPVAVSCGFCAMEAYGVLFQRVTATSGLLPSDFPLVVQSISLALGAAQVSGSPAACHGIATPLDPDTLVHVEIWGGTGAPPDVNDIHAMPPPGMAWPGEDLVFSLDDVPVTMSVPTSDGAADFNLMLNTLALDDGTTPAPTVDATHTYLRAVVVLNDGGSSSTCTPDTNAPTAFPLRDDDGVILNHRSMIFAQGGVGWLWNETAGVHGDWGIRLSINPLPHGDGGVVGDAGAADGGATDAGATGADAGAAPPARSCACRAGRSPSSPLAAIVAVGVALGLGRRRARLRA